MKVLMFGWEFPPHISGGLGTACEGLTRALSELKVETMFVVPKLFGSEDQSRFPIVSASEIHVPLFSNPEPHIEINGTPAEKRFVKIKSDELSDVDFPVEKRTIVNNQKTQTETPITTIEVQSTLLPYAHPSIHAKFSTLTHWIEEWQRVQITLQGSPAVRGSVRSESPTSVKTGEPVIKKQEELITKRTYSFSGTYGPDLIGETLRYAEVAHYIAAKEEFDFIHAHDWITYPAGIAAKKQSGKKLIVHVHATEIDRSGALPHPIVFAIEKEGLIKADHVVAVSEWTRSILIRHYEIPGEKISVVHNGVVSKEKLLFPTTHKLGAHYVTFLGRITYQKGPLYFVEAAAKVIQRFPLTHFIVAGSGDMLPQMVELIAELRLSSHFHFTGFLKGSQIDQVWSLTDLYVMPSVSEPFGITPLEASHSGVPVIVSKQSGVAEVMTHAIKVDFWNVDELANAICGVLAYPSLANTLVHNSREELKEITWEKAAEKMIKIYEQHMTT